ncbi:MAG: AMP-binding protein [Alphaproteobacteria bacterium]|jgi:long-chain acyl-CoA synthetase|nr:AMP-binding protein [Alphaproteobacteria bacterium]
MTPRPDPAPEADQDPAGQDNLLAMVFAQARRFGDRPLLWSKHGGRFHAVTWSETVARARDLAAGLRRIGVADGDRVVIVAENRPEWLIADLAIMAAGGLTVPAYTTYTVDDYRHILGDSGAVGAIVSQPALFRRVWPAALQTKTARFVVALDPPDHPHDDSVAVTRWDDVVAEGRANPDDIDARVARLNRDDVACIIYTSGTTSHPRGVMLTHGGMLSNCAGARDLVSSIGIDNDIFLSFLPLSHAYEHTAGQYFPMMIGAQIYYAESVEALASSLREVRPTMMAAVPRFYELLRQRITKDLARRGGMAARLFDWALTLGKKRYQRGGRLGPVDSLLDWPLERLVRDKVRERFGGRLKGMVSGGAPLTPEVGLFFHALGLTVLQGYGQTEASPIVACNRPGDEQFHTVGPPLKDVEVRIADDGEILVRGELLMKGYWNNPDATAQALRDGWLHTGDVGHVDGRGHIVITDRKKDIIVNSGGDNISPQRVEGLMVLEPEIGQAMVIGDRRPYLVGLIVPDSDFMTSWANTHAKPADLAQLAEDADFHAAIGAAIDRTNAQLSQIERVRRFVIAPAPFTIENNELTPTMKIRRHAILAEYGDRLRALYGSAG